MPITYGALPEEWDHFDKALELRADLLPVVSNPTAVISEKSKMQKVGKTPSVYNPMRHVHGIVKWTIQKTHGADITRWKDEPDYGLCIQTRRVRALDVDIPNPEEAALVKKFINDAWGELPERMRSNSSKFLFAFFLFGQYEKRTITTKHGIIEFLANGQQFVACGMHPDGARYEWRGGLPDELPEFTIDMFNKLWSELQLKFGIEPAKDVNPSIPREHKLHEAISNDETATFLSNQLGRVLSTERDGRLHITCPFESDHTGVSAESSTTYFPANTGGYALGHFKCLHAHCTGRSDEEFRSALGMPTATDGFEDLDAPRIAEVGTQDTHPGASELGGDTDHIRQRFHPHDLEEFVATGHNTAWLVKGILPKAELAVVYGASSSGKTFWVLDVMACVARGELWCGRKTTKSSVLYIAAEGAGGLRKRVTAYSEYHGVPLSALANLKIISDAPRLNNVEDRKALAKVIKHMAPGIVVIDTLAATTPGADENSGKDMGEVIAYCKAIHKHTGALVVLVHHSGKDTEKGARGWSGLRAAADAEVLIVRSDNDRAAIVTKLKDGSDEDVEHQFKLNTVELGIDEDGDPITSCVVIQSTKPHAPSIKNPILKLVMLTLEDMTALQVEISVNELIEAVIPKLPMTEKKDNRREKVIKALETASADGGINLYDGVITLPL